MSTRPRLITPRFAIIVASGICYFMALGVVMPNVPRYVKNELGGGSIAVGLAVGVLFVGAVMLRPLAGRIGDRYGRRLLLIGGAATVAVSMVGYAVSDHLVPLVIARLVTGVGEAAFFVGAATMITDLAPEERRGEAISYWSIAVYSRFAFGPALGEIVQKRYGYTTLWLVAAALGALAASLGCFTRETERERAVGPMGPLIHRRALRPGGVLFLGLIATAAFGAFVPLYAEQVGIEDVGIVFVVFGGLVLLVRTFGARLPDALGGGRAGTVALVSGASGMLLMAVWGTAVGLMTGVVVFAIGAAFLYPAMLLLALDGASVTERGSIVGTVSSCFDASQGIGSLVVGGVAALTSYRGAFATGAVASTLGLVLLWRIASPRLGPAEVRFSP